MQICISNKKKNVISAVILIIGLWFILSLFNSPFVIPPISSVFKQIWFILTSVDRLEDIFITFTRLSIAMLISIIGGIFFGVLFGTIFPFKNVIKEMLKIFQVVPPVSVLIMAIIWFGLNGIPAMFIVIFSLIPLISIHIMDAIENIDSKLVEMAKVFKFSKFSMLKYVYFPSVAPALWSVIVISLTIGAKIIVMGEVLTTSTGIGGRITTARLNIEPETIIAWTIIMVCLYYILETAINLLHKKSRFGKKDF